VNRSHQVTFIGAKPSRETSQGALVMKDFCEPFVREKPRFVKGLRYSCAMLSSEKETIALTDRITLAEYQRAASELRTEQERIGFIVHAVVYALVNALLITINLVYVPAVIWFFYPLIGWGIGLLMHFLFSIVWVQNQTESWQAKVEHRAGLIHATEHIPGAMPRAV
jgi:2TM domain